MLECVCVCVCISWRLKCWLIIEYLYHSGQFSAILVQYKLNIYGCPIRIS